MAHQRYSVGHQHAGVFAVSDIHQIASFRPVSPLYLDLTAEKRNRSATGRIAFLWAHDERLIYREGPDHQASRIGIGW